MVYLVVTMDLTSPNRDSISLVRIISYKVASILPNCSLCLFRLLFGSIPLLNLSLLFPSLLRPNRLLILFLLLCPPWRLDTQSGSNQPAGHSRALLGPLVHSSISTPPLRRVELVVRL